ncbi:MAG: hypothetical protein IJY46_03395 [Lentisphaeria bacterium]|nr:hypothetical protein [Lentisphaeria bacterium]
MILILKEKIHPGKHSHPTKSTAAIKSGSIRFHYRNFSPHLTAAKRSMAGVFHLWRAYFAPDHEK